MLTDHLYGLRARLFLLVTLAILPALGTMVYTATEQRTTAAAAARANALHTAQVIADSQALLAENARHVLQALAEIPPVRQADPTVCTSHLASLVAEQGRYVNAGLIAPDGTILCSVRPVLRPGNLRDWSFVRRALATRTFSIGDYHWAFAANQAAPHFAVPVFAAPDTVRALLFVALDLGWLNKHQANTELPSGSTLMLWDREGVVLSRYPEPQAWLGKAMRDTPLFQRIATHDRAGTEELTDTDGIRRLYGFLPIRHTDRGIDAYVAVGIPTAVAYADADRLLRRNLIVLALAAALAVVLAWAGADVFVLRQVRTLVAASRRLAAGEIGQLAQAFDDMAASLERAEAELRRLNAGLEERVHKRTAELRKVNAALKAVNEELTNFAYVVSHDLKAPLRGIGSLADWLSTDYSERLREDDSDRSAMRALFNALRETYRDQIVTAATMAEDAARAAARFDGGGREHDHPDLHDALEQIAGANPNARQIGYLRSVDQSKPLE